MDDSSAMRRRQLLRHGLGLVLTTWGLRSSSPASAQEGGTQTGSVSTLFVADEVDEAVDRAIDFILSQQRDDGSIQDRGFAVAMTSLAIMSLASIGVVPDAESLRGRALTRAIDFVLNRRHQDPLGYFGDSDGSRMYGHGITTLMLTELLGMGVSIDQNRRIHDSLEKALKLILASQAITKLPQYQGGWRYTPSSRDSDLSVSIWQLMALRSAKNDGLDVPGEAIDLAIDYLQNSYASPLDENGVPRDPVSGFCYTPGTRAATFTMTSAGLLAMQVCGRYESPLVLGAAEWLLQSPPRRHERFFFYGIYYYAQGMHQVGGKYAGTAANLVPALLLDDQNSDGSWVGRSSDEQKYGKVYSTALAILSLSVRYHYLPIYQR